jgi:hypothetical protein
VETELARRAMDWTVEGKDGERWGVSPGKLHLGTVTLPLPVQLRGTPDDEEAARAWAEAQRHADHARTRSLFDERARALRERRERERAGGS